MKAPRFHLSTARSFFVLSLGIFLATSPAALAETGELDLRSALELTLGAKPSPEEAEQLEAGLAENPDDLEARVRLIEYYAPYEPATRRSWEAHLRWLLEKYPADEATAALTRRIDAVPYEEASELAERLWLEQIERYPGDPRVQANAARFFTLADRELAEKLFEKARKLEPENPSWDEGVALLRRLEAREAEGEAGRTLARDAYETLQRTVAQAPPERRHRQLPELGKAALAAGDLEAARRYADEMLQVAADSPDASYRDDLVHYGHLVLGRLAVRDGDLDQAKENLLAAARVAGSFQLRSFGPNMTLAEELLRAGERDAVLEYLQLVGEFWSSGAERLETWRVAIESEEIPDFGANLLY